MSAEAGHSHTRKGGADDAPEHDGPDWFKALDIIVWVSVAVVVVVAAEWFLGKLIRERISSQASRYLKRVTPDGVEE